MSVLGLAEVREHAVLGQSAAGIVDPRLRFQAQQIIDEVLASDSPAEEDARALLRKQVEANPGRPERALLIHLMTFQRP
jgi:hypothetical protein